jgi:D-3-phosphoglycerate dehydrogenase
VKIVIPDDYQDMVHRLSAFSLISHHDVVRYREPARDLDQLIARLSDADMVVAIRERVAFSRALLTRLPKLRLIALVGRTSHMLDLAAATELGIPVSTGVSNSPVAPAELTLALIVAARRNIALEAERMKRGEWPCTLSHRLRGSTLGIFGLGAIGALVAETTRQKRRPLPGTRSPKRRPSCSSAPTCFRSACGCGRRPGASWALRISRG